MHPSFVRVDLTRLSASRRVLLNTFTAAVPARSPLQFRTAHTFLTRATSGSPSPSASHTNLKSSFSASQTSRPSLTQARSFAISSAAMSAVAAAPLNPAPSAVANSQSQPSYILTMSCQDKPGIVHQVTGVLASNGLNILESAQYGDPITGSFFLRIHFAPSPAAALPKTNTIEQLTALFEPVVNQFENASWKVSDTAHRPKVVVLVSKIGHCLNSLLFAQRSGAVPIDIPLVISNHTEYEGLCKSAGIPFAHVPVTKDTKAEAEAKQIQLIRDSGAELVVMARYMQVLTPNFIRSTPPVINVHHALLPAFKGGRPYFQAHEKGVKLIGATAHFASAELDEGPIIEQDVERVNHTLGPKELTQIGAHVECVVLERAVKWFAESRLLMNGLRTVIFS